MNNRLLYPVLVFSLFLGLLSPPADSCAQELSVDFEEQLVIGNQENPPMEYIFGGPRFIKTDSEYRIYVVTRSKEIRVFSPQGEHIKTIGRSGRGPGEFLAISGITFGYNDKLIINDQQSNRITWFYGMGDSIETMRLEHPYWMGGYIAPLGDEKKQFVTAVRRPSWIYEYLVKYREVDFDPINDEDRLIYLLSTDFSKRSDAMFNIFEHMFDKESPVETELARGGYRLVILNDSMLVITNEDSNGSLYILNIGNGEVNKVSGPFSEWEPYQVLNWNRRHSYWEDLAGVVVMGGGRDIVYQRKLRSAELLSNNKWVLNFIHTSDGNQITYNIEFLDYEGNYIGYTRIDDDFPIVEEQYSNFIDATVQTVHFDPLHLDDRDRLYYVDYSSGIPVIRVTKIIMEQ